jgi:hypothetical protein
MKKLIAVTSVLALFAVSSGLFAQEAEEPAPAPVAGTFAWSGWARSSFTMDLTEDAETIKPESSGAGVTLTYTKGDLKLTASTETSLYTKDGNLTWNFEEAVVKVGAEYWNQDTNTWGAKGAWKPLGSNTLTMGALFLQFLNQKLLLTSGFGDYGDEPWGTPGPFEYGTPADPVVRFEIKPIKGLNFGFAYGKNLAPATYSNEANNVNPFGDDLDGSNLSFGVKYDVKPVVVAAGFNTNDNGKESDAYFGVSFAASDALTIKLDGYAEELGTFSDTGAFYLGENVSYAAGPLSAGLTFKENHLIHNKDAKDAKDMELVISPSVKYAVIEKKFLVKLAVEFTKGLGDANEDLSKVDIKPSLYFSLNDKVTDDADDLNTGFAVFYKFGVGKEYPEDSTTAVDYKANALSFAFRAAF